MSEVDEVKAHFDMRINGLEELLLKNQNNRIEIDNEAYKIEYDEAILINVKRDTANVDIPRKIRVYNRRYEVKRISFGAFIDCERTLVSVTIPESVEDIASGTFDNCAKLREINVAEGNSRYSSKDGILYDKSGTELIKYPAGNGATEFTIPDRVTAIGQGAFKHCTSLESIFIPTGVVAIGKRAFKYCTNLRSILIPDSVESIGDSAFDNCKFVEVTMPANAIESMTRGDLQIVTIIGKHDIPDVAFISARNLEKVTITDSVGNIGDRAFDRCSSLVEVTIGAGVKKIGNNAFSNCASLQSVQLGEGSNYDDNTIQYLSNKVFNADLTKLAPSTENGWTKIDSLTGTPLNLTGKYMFYLTSANGISVGSYYDTVMNLGWGNKLVFHYQTGFARIWVTQTGGIGGKMISDLGGSTTITTLSLWYKKMW